MSHFWHDTEMNFGITASDNKVLPCKLIFCLEACVGHKLTFAVGKG